MKRGQIQLFLNILEGESVMKDNSSARTDKKSVTDHFGMPAPLPAEAAVTMAYVPFQTDSQVYEPDTALIRGTLFPVLDKPFLRAGCK
ncbi:MAG: spore coat associated protein CotJA [Clostridia bacterium]|nr:spore coat associated protein CotJA [Clostridia bacterium]